MPTLPLPGALLPSSSEKGLADGDPFAGIEARLDHLSDQMELCLAEVTGWKQTPPSGHQAATPKNTGLKFLKVFPAGASRSSGRRSAESRSSKISQRSDRTEVTVVDQGSGPAKRATVNAPARRTRAPRSMDLEIAWRLHAREIAQEDGETIKPLLRLVERRRADIVWELLDDPNSSRAAWYISQLLKAVVILSVLWTNLQIIEEPVVDLGWACAVETVIDSLFLVEFICRVLSAPSKRNYFLDPLNWADVLTALALPIRASIGFVIVANASSGQNVAQHLLLFFVPVVRFLKLLRYFESFRLLIDACGKSAEALPVLVYMTCLIVLLAATAIYLAEDRGNIPSMPHSLWLALVTMTTVGYGDYYPTSLAGYLTVSVLTFVSVLFLALPVGIIGHEFTMSWQSRIQVLLMNRFRKSLNKWGYGSEDLKVLINYVDLNGDGELAFEEFVELVHQMRIGISTEEAALLFSFFDVDQNGFLEHRELLKHLYPREYVKSVGRGLKSEHRSSRQLVSDAISALERTGSKEVEEDLVVSAASHSPQNVST